MRQAKKSSPKTRVQENDLVCDVLELRDLSIGYDDVLISKIICKGKSRRDNRNSRALWHWKNNFAQNNCRINSPIIGRSNPRFSKEKWNWLHTSETWLSQAF